MGRLTKERREKIENWFLKNGKRVYFKFLLSYPLNTIRIIFDNIKMIFSVKNSPAFPLFLLVFFWLFNRWSFSLKEKTKVIKLIKNNSFFHFFLSLFVVSWLSLCFVFIMDATEILRHSLVSLLGIFVSLIGFEAVTQHRVFFQTSDKA